MRARHNLYSIHRATWKLVTRREQIRKQMSSAHTHAHAHTTHAHTHAHTRARARTEENSSNISAGKCHRDITLYYLLEIHGLNLTSPTSHEAINMHASNKIDKYRWQLRRFQVPAGRASAPLHACANSIVHAWWAATINHIYPYAVYLCHRMGRSQTYTIIDLQGNSCPSVGTNQ